MNYYLLLKERSISYAEKPFLYIGEEIYSYRAFFTKIERMTQHLSRVIKDDLKNADVLVSAESFLNQALLFFAVQKFNARPILLHHGLVESDIEHIAKTNDLQGIFILNAESLSYKRFPYEARQHEYPDCLGVLSSGTTGTPKVMYRTFESWAGFFPVQNEIFGLKETSCLFFHGSLSFTGNLNAFLAALFIGASVCTSECTNVKLWIALMEKHTADIIYLVPAKLRLLVEAIKVAISSVRSVFTGSQIISASLLRLLQRKLPNASIILYYGASELNYITYAHCSDCTRDPRNVGIPFPGVDISVADGLIYVNTPFHVSGITLPFTLHDKGYMNEQGELIFEGREQAWVNKGGFKISLERVELKIKAVAGIREAAVLPVEDEVRGADLVAFLVPSDGIEKKQLRRMVRSALLPVEMPKKIYFLAEIPLNDRGKLAKDLLLKEIRK